MKSRIGVQAYKVKHIIFTKISSRIVKNEDWISQENVKVVGFKHKAELKRRHKRRQTLMKKYLTTYHAYTHKNVMQEKSTGRTYELC